MRPRLLAAAVVVAALLSCAAAPRGNAGPAADALASRIESAVNLEAWNKVGVVSWSFLGGHRWLWDRTRGVVRLQQGDSVVLLDTWDHGGFVIDNVAAGGTDVSGADADRRLGEAWSLFINDSFWLNPFATLRNPDAHRELVTIDGATALLIRYESGGVTPGDSYAFFVNEQGVPTRWKLWVQVVPIKGFETTFEDWVDVDGARIASNHKAAGLSLSLNPIKGGQTLKDAGVDVDPFARLIARRR